MRVVYSVCEGQHQASPHQGAFGPQIRFKRCSPWRKTIQNGAGSPDEKGSGILIVIFAIYGDSAEVEDHPPQLSGARLRPGTRPQPPSWRVEHWTCRKGLSVDRRTRLRRRYRITERHLPHRNSPSQSS